MQSEELDTCALNHASAGDGSDHERGPHERADRGAHGLAERLRHDERQQIHVPLALCRERQKREEIRDAVTGFCCLVRRLVDAVGDLRQEPHLLGEIDPDLSALAALADLLFDDRVLQPTADLRETALESGKGVGFIAALGRQNIVREPRGLGLDDVHHDHELQIFERGLHGFGVGIGARGVRLREEHGPQVIGLLTLDLRRDDRDGIDAEHREFSGLDCAPCVRVVFVGALAASGENVLHDAAARHK